MRACGSHGWTTRNHLRAGKAVAGLDVIRPRQQRVDDLAPPPCACYRNRVAFARRLAGPQTGRRRRPPRCAPALRAKLARRPNRLTVISRLRPAARGSRRRRPRLSSTGAAASWSYRSTCSTSTLPRGASARATQRAGIGLQHRAGARRRPAAGTSARQAAITGGLSSTAVVRMRSSWWQKRVIAAAPRPSCTAWPLRQLLRRDATASRPSCAARIRARCAHGCVSSIAPCTHGVSRCR